MIFLLNLEIAYCCPPLGLNLFISSFRFNRPVASLYRVVLPFAASSRRRSSLVSYVPAHQQRPRRGGHRRRARRRPRRSDVPPREAWIMECVQEDRTNPQPCTDEDKKAWPNGQAPEAANPEPETQKAVVAAVAADAGEGEESDQDLEAMIMGGGKRTRVPRSPRLPRRGTTSRATRTSRS